MQAGLIVRAAAGLALVAEAGGASGIVPMLGRPLPRLPMETRRVPFPERPRPEAPLPREPRAPEPEPWPVPLPAPWKDEALPMKAEAQPQDSTRFVVPLKEDRVEDVGTAEAREPVERRGAGFGIASAPEVHEARPVEAPRTRRAPGGRRPRPRSSI